ncbi:type I-E CRISPR-associated protein Cse2/CasB [Hornefia porci]|uniref:Type I-E CRISPR-associated protein Cse2/CasB n=1 Tax=Hornefia porci TaxID=2652292 RepID=A0A1Q9JKF8_9FIRM|nr:type I-E CRISPR-associated protein Cse2/CasB [Hornefia porci]OLR56644.1 type I-E CRISPR-associated protein Cse2/CasB [Hornefia porci]
MKDNKPTVYQVVRNFISALDKQSENKNVSGILAVLRNSLGKEYEDASNVWPVIIPFMPDEFMGSGTPTYEEKAIYNTLQLYALGQQGSSKVENDKDTRNMGASLSALRTDDSASLDRRFSAMINSSSYNEFFQHMKHLFKLGKSKGNFKVNYPKLAEDLFWYQMGNNRQVSLNWARDYYRSRAKNTDRGNSEDKTNNEE